MKFHNGDIDLIDGCAVSMGEGTFVVLQESDEGPQSVVLTGDDLRAMLAVVEAS